MGGCDNPDLWPDDRNPEHEWWAWWEPQCAARGAQNINQEVHSDEHSTGSR
jgi:hypothetical protein